MSNSINKVIEQVAYKQVEDMIVYLEMLDEQFLKTSKTARENAKLFGIPSVNNSDLNKKLLESQKIIKQLQDDYKKNQDALDKLTKKVDEHTKAKAKMTQEGRNAIIDAREERKILDGNAVANSNLTTYIQKLSVERAKAGRIVADYNAQIAMNIKLTEEQSQELTQATAQFQKYDNAIKAGKTSIGDAREYVGQYERANVGLSNSIGQIARELPSATFGFQTFALGISNNIPIAVDEIKKAVEINKELIAQGKPTTSVWKQVGSALLSFNTIMSVGLLLLALYGKEIANLFKELTSGKTKINALNESQKLLNESTIEGTKAVKDETVELRSNLAIARDNNLTKKERLIAVDKIIKQYPFYFEGLTKEEILAGKTEKAERKLTDALLARAKSTAAMNKIQEQQSKIIDIEENLYNLKNKLTLAESQYEKAVKTTATTTSAIGGLSGASQEAQVAKIKNKIKVQEDEKKALTEVVERITGYVIENDKASIGLDYQTDSTNENTKAIKLNTKAREDYLASEYELWKLRKTNQSNLNKDIMDDEASGYELRLLASEQYYENQLDLANRESQEEIRILKFATDERLRTTQNEYLNQKEQLDTYLSDGKISRAKYNIALKDAEEQLQYDRSGILQDATNKQNIIYENQAQRLIEINKELVGVMQKAYDEINFQKADIEIAEVDLKGIEKVKEILSGVQDGLSIKEIDEKLKEVSRLVSQSTADVNLREAQLELDRKLRDKQRLEREIRINGEINNLSKQQIEEQVFNNKTLLDLDEEIIDAKKKVLEADNQVKNAQIDNLKELQQAREDYNEAVLDSANRLNADVSNLANQLFENSIS